MKQVQMFIADDGTEFTTEDECFEHEKLIELRDIASKFAHWYLVSNDPNGTGDPPAQRSITRVVNVVLGWDEWSTKSTLEGATYDDDVTLKAAES